LAAKLIFGSFLIGQLVVAAMVAAIHPWIWMLPLTLPIIALLIDHQYHHLKDVVMAHLDASARDLKLVRITRREGNSSPEDSKAIALAPPASTTATV